MNRKNYNRVMAHRKIESLLEAANSASEGDTSVSSAKRQFADEEMAAAFFNDTRERLLRIQQWRKNSSLTDYDLFNEGGEQSNDENLAVGIFIRIALSGSGKYDWVRVESTTEESEEFVVTASPTFDPTAKGRDLTAISHFFGPKATNNFCLQLNGKTVALYVIGLNEHQNTSFTDSLIQSARNAAVANVGYYTGLQKSVWKEFCSNFLKSDEEKLDEKNS